MRNYFSLPQFNPGDMRVNTAPVQNALESWGQTTRQNELLKRQADEQAYQRGRDQKQDARADETYKMQALERLGKSAFAFSQLDPDKRDPVTWGRLVKGMQSFEPAIGTDPDDLDPIAGPAKFAAVYGGIARDPREDKLMDLKLRGAEADLAKTEREEARDKRFQGMLTGDPESVFASLPDPIKKAAALRLAAGDRDGALDIITKAATPPAMSVAEKKEVFSSEDEKILYDNQIKTLDQALGLISEDAEKKGTAAFEGLGSGIGGYIGAKVPGGGFVVDEARAKATTEYDNIMSLEAIKSMSDLLKGATTERELAEFQRILSDPGQPREIRRRVIDRMKSLLQDKSELAARRASELRSGDYFRSGDGSVRPPARSLDIGGGFTLEVD